MAYLCCFMLDQDFNSLTGVNRCIVPFIACGDLSAFDSDMTYPMEVIPQLVNTMVDLEYFLWDATSNLWAVYKLFHSCRVQH